MLQDTYQGELASAPETDHHQGVLPEAWAASGAASWIVGKVLGLAAENLPIERIPVAETATVVAGKMYEYGGLGVLALGAGIKLIHVGVARLQR